MLLNYALKFYRWILSIIPLHLKTETELVKKNQKSDLSLGIDIGHVGKKRDGTERQKDSELDTEREREREREIWTDINSFFYQHNEHRNETNKTKFVLS